MKRYLAFYGMRYYPMAAMGDFIGDFDNVDEAVNAVKDKAKPDIKIYGEELDYSWGRVWDSVERKNIYEIGYE